MTGDDDGASRPDRETDHRSGRGSAGLPLLTPPDGRGRREPKRVAGVLLAAGTSSRFGSENKLLADLEGEPIVRHAVCTLLEARVDPVVVVLGHDADRVETTLEGLPVEFVRNEAYSAGQATSVRAGIGSVRTRAPDSDGALIALGDMPFVSPETVDTLVDAYEAGLGEVLAPAFDGKRGNPVLFDRRFFDQLAAVEGDIGGREILLESGHGVLVSVDERGVHRDVDTTADL